MSTLDFFTDGFAISVETNVDEEDSVKLLHRWKQGDEAAARILFDRYVNGLCALARNRLSAQMARRVEPEDIVNSAYRSFFRKAGNNNYSLSRSGDFWKLLTKITITKLQGQVEFHTAKKRHVYSEDSHDTAGLQPEFVALDPSPEDATAVVEELQSVLVSLDPLSRQVLELALQNHSEDEIASFVTRSGQTVRRVLQQIKSDLEQRLFSQPDE